MKPVFGVFCLSLCSCAIGDAAFGDRFEALDESFALDKIENTTWTLDTVNGDLTSAHRHCGQITRTCASYWRLPTEREWADVLDVDLYLNNPDDVRPTEPTIPEALKLEAGRFWNTIGAERPSEAYIGSFGHVVDPRTAVGDDVGASEMHLTRCVCTGPD